MLRSKVLTLIILTTSAFSAQAQTAGNSTAAPGARLEEGATSTSQSVPEAATRSDSTTDSGARESNIKQMNVAPKNGAGRSPTSSAPK
jgi:hypothetical protein